MKSESPEIQLANLVRMSLDGSLESVNLVLDHIGPNPLKDVARIDELVALLESNSDPRSHVLSAVLAFEREDDERFETELELGLAANEIYALVVNCYFALEDENAFEYALRFLESTSPDSCPLASNLLKLVTVERDIDGIESTPLQPSDLLELLWEGDDICELAVRSGNEIEFNLGSYSSDSLACFDIGSLAGSPTARYWSVVARIERIQEWLSGMDRGLSSICQRDLRVMQSRIHALRSLNNAEQELDLGQLDQLSSRIRALQADTTEEELTNLLNSSDEYVIDTLIKSRRLSEVQAANLRALVEANLNESDLFDDLIESLNGYEVEGEVSEGATPYSPVVSELLYRAQQMTASEELVLEAIAAKEFQVWEPFEEGWQSLYWHPNATQSIRDAIIQKVFGPYERNTDNLNSTSFNLECEYFMAIDPRIDEDVANRLADHPSRLVRQALSENPAIPAMVRESLKSDSDAFVRRNASKDWSWTKQVWPS